MTSLGTDLRLARETAGVGIREMATRTKISVTALEALERDDYSRLPGGIFGRSFVRSYAVEVGLDPDQIVERFVEGLEKSEREAAERRRAAQPAVTLDDQQFLERQRRALLGLRVVVALVIIAAIAAVVWGVRVAWPMWRGSVTTQPVVEAPAAAAAPAPAAPAPAADPSATGALSPAGTPAAAAALVVDLETTGDCLVAVSVDGKPQTSRLFKAGEVSRYEAAEQMLLDVADAGAVRIVINGQPAKPLGAAGAHVRTRLTRDNLREFF